MKEVGRPQSRHGGHPSPRLASGEARWVPVESLVYREVDAQELLVFQEDGEGHIVRALLGRQPHVAFERLAWHERAGFHVGLVAVAVLVFLSAVVGWPLMWRWGDGGMGPLAHRTAWAASALFLVFLAGLAIVLRDPMEIAFGVPERLEPAGVQVLTRVVSGRRRRWTAGSHARRG